MLISYGRNNPGRFLGKRERPRLDRKDRKNGVGCGQAKEKRSTCGNQSELRDGCEHCLFLVP